MDSYSVLECCDSSIHYTLHDLGINVGHGKDGENLRQIEALTNIVIREGINANVLFKEQRLIHVLTTCSTEKLNIEKSILQLSMN